MLKNEETPPSASPEVNKAEKPQKEGSRFDGFAKGLTVVLALFGVGQYFYDTAASRANDKKGRSISYIEQYAEGSLLDARQELAEFWSEQPALVGIFKTTTINSRSYNALLDASVFRSGKDQPIQRALLRLENFFTQVGFCRSSNLCEASLLDLYFCETAQKYTFVYGPFFDQISKRSGDSSIGHELARYAGACAKS